MALASGRDLDRVEWAFHEDGCGAGLEGFSSLMEPEEEVALLIVGGLRAVEVLGDVGGGAGTRPADESGEPAVGGVDGQHDPVAELIDEGPAGGPASEPGRFDCLLGVSGSQQVACQLGPSGGGVTDVPFPDCWRCDATGEEVGGTPAVCQLTAEDCGGGIQDGLLTGVLLRSSDGGRSRW